jgi:DNA-directed RNA polymerase specialized sigma24 family protein
MNSVALPASATSPPSALSAEADLVRLAARGNAEAFGELYRRHSQPAWRLAQAVAPDRDAAIGGFRDGFVRALAAQRRARKDDGGTFRSALLAAVYKASADIAAATPISSPNRRPAENAEAALADAAFRSLPDRWRAAVWLSDVENLDADRIAPILGVSPAVATQLLVRGRRGLAGRFTQAHRDVPELFGPVLRPLALALPANLAEIAHARWAVAGSERGPVLAPMATWLEEKAVRPMTVAIGALLGLGLIGLGVVPQGSAVRAQLGASGANNPGALPVQTCFGLACSTGPGGFGTAGLLGPGSGFAPATGTFGGGAGGGAAPGSGSTGGPSAPAPSTGGSQPPSPGSPGSPGSGPSSPPPTISTPVANATVSGNSVGVTLLPNSSGSGGLATVTVGGNSALCVTSGSTSVGCSSGTSTQSTSTLSTTTTSTTTTTLPLLQTVQGVSNSLTSGL